MLNWPDVVSVDDTDTFYRIRGYSELGTTVQMCTHKIMTIVQPGFNYRRYPQDKQAILVIFFSLSLKNFQLQLISDNSGESGVDYVVDENGGKAIEENQIWKFLSASIKYQDIKFASGKSEKEYTKPCISVKKI